MRKAAKLAGIGTAAVMGTLAWAALADMPAQGGAHGMGMHQGMVGPMGGGMSHGMGPAAMPGGPGHVAIPARIEALKTELGITSAQEAAWKKYADALQEASAAMQATRESMDHDALRRMSPSDRHAFATTMHEQRQEQLETVGKAANELLATLDDSQKAKAADILPGLSGGGHGMGHGSAAGPRHGHSGR